MKKVLLEPLQEIFSLVKFLIKTQFSRGFFAFPFSALFLKQREIGMENYDDNVAKLKRFSFSCFIIMDAVGWSPFVGVL